MKMEDIKHENISSVNRVKNRTRKQPSQATTKNMMIMTQNPIQQRQGSNSRWYLSQNWNEKDRMCEK